MPDCVKKFVIHSQPVIFSTITREVVNYLGKNPLKIEAFLKSYFSGNERGECGVVAGSPDQSVEDCVIGEERKI